MVEKRKMEKKVLTRVCAKYSNKVLRIVVKLECSKNTILDWYNWVVLKIETW